MECKYQIFLLIHKEKINIGLDHRNQIRPFSWLIEWESKVVAAMSLVETGLYQSTKWTPLMQVSCCNPQTIQESMTCFLTSIVKATKIKYSTKLELVDLVQAVTIVVRIKWQETNKSRWDKQCSTVTSWPNYDKAMPGTQPPSTISARHKPTNTICPWWLSMTGTPEDPVPLAQLHQV